MLTTLRKRVISNLANTVSETFYNKNHTDLQAAAADEEIACYFDHYEDSFDGMLVYYQRHFHIHLNLDRGNHPDSKRGRFSLAHELGHYFIDEHRIALKKGILLPHASLQGLNQKESIEEEADYFAACLLMPDYRFCKPSGNSKFSLDTILKLSNEFGASVVATTLRFAEIGRHPALVVFSKGNIVRWYAVNHDFPKWSFKFSVGNALPPATVAGEFFTRADAKYTSVEDLDPDSWFYPAWSAQSQMHEQCYYSDSFDYVISIIWFD